MNLAVLFSGGKDSILALARAKKHHKISCLITIESKNPESYMFHTPNIQITTLQAKALKLPIITQKTTGKKETELKDLKKALKKAKSNYNIEGVVTGAIASIYQVTRIQKICDELNFYCFNPLWQINQIDLLNQLIKDKYKVIISGVFAYPFTKDFLGKSINKDLISKLKLFQEKYKINPSGEGGEIETTVLNCPLFKKEIKILDSTTQYDNYAGTYQINKAYLNKK